MNTWKQRAAVGGIFGAVIWLHDLTADLFPNTVLGMLAYHTSAALCDLGLLLLLPLFVCGKLRRDLQGLCALSILANFGGWLAYREWVSPSYYDGFMLGLIIVQALRILWADNVTTSLGVPLVHRFTPGSGDSNVTKG